jgi:hypothetical protein
VWLSVSIKAALKTAAEAEGKTISSVVREAVTAWLCDARPPRNEAPNPYPIQRK